MARLDGKAECGAVRQFTLPVLRSAEVQRMWREYQHRFGPMARAQRCRVWLSSE